MIVKIVGSSQNGSRVRVSPRDMKKRLIERVYEPYFCDPNAVTKIFIVSCATDSYEMRFCDAVPQIVVHFDLSGSKCGTNTASFYRP